MRGAKENYNFRTIKNFTTDQKKDYYSKIISANHPIEVEDQKDDYYLDNKAGKLLSTIKDSYSKRVGANLPTAVATEP